MLKSNRKRDHLKEPDTTSELLYDLPSYNRVSIEKALVNENVRYVYICTYKRTTTNPTIALPQNPSVFTTIIKCLWATRHFPLLSHAVRILPQPKPRTTSRPIQLDKIGLRMCRSHQAHEPAKNVVVQCSQC